MTELYIPTFDYLNKYTKCPTLICPDCSTYELCYLGPAGGIDRISAVDYDKDEGRIVLTYKSGDYNRPYSVMIYRKYTTDPKIMYEGVEVEFVHQNITDLSKLKILV